MSETSRKLWSSLTERLSRLPDNAAKAEYGSALAEWVRENRIKIGSDLLARYGLDRLTVLSFDEFPVEDADLNVAVERTNVSKQRPSSVEVIAMLVRDQIWNIIAFKTRIECLNCGEDKLRALIDPGTDDALVLACDLCGWAQDERGRPWRGQPGCRPAKTSELRGRGFLS